MSPFELYMILKFDDFINFFSGVFRISLIVAMVLGVITLLLYGCVYENPKDRPKYVEPAKKFKKITFIVMWIMLFSLTIRTLLPNTKQMATLIVVPKILTAEDENEILNQIPNRILNLTNDWLIELSPKQDEE